MTPEEPLRDSLQTLSEFRKLGDLLDAERIATNALVAELYARCASAESTLRDGQPPSPAPAQETPRVSPPSRVNVPGDTGGTAGASAASAAGEKLGALEAVAWGVRLANGQLDGAKSHHSGAWSRAAFLDAEYPADAPHTTEAFYAAATVRELQAEIERLTSENARLLGALDVAIGYTQQRDELTAEVARLTAENKDRCAAIADWARATGRSTPADARIRIESLLGANARADAYDRSLAARTAELGAVRRERDASLDARGVERDSARAEVARLTAEVRAYERTITSNAGAFLTRIDKLTASLASVTAERDEARAREDDASNRAQRFKDARDDARAQLAAQQSPPPAPTKGE